MPARGAVGAAVPVPDPAGAVLAGSSWAEGRRLLLAMPLDAQAAAAGTTDGP